MNTKVLFRLKENIVYDQLSRPILLGHPPCRIISLVPSITELLYSLGLGERVIGITKFCKHPQEWYQTKTRIGGTKTVNLNKIKALKPDLIIANKEENVKDQIDILAKDFPVYISDVKNLSTAIEMISSIGKLTHTLPKATKIISRILKNFKLLQPTTSKKRVAYLIWQNPYITIGKDTFINDMLRLMGVTNVFGLKTRYPIISIDDLRQKNCDCLLLSSEPFPFKNKHIMELQTLLPKTKIMLVDGELFSWYGSRLIQTPSYLYKLSKKINKKKRLLRNQKTPTL